MKKQKLNRDELYFDGIFVVLISIFQFSFNNFGAFLTASVNPILIIIFGVFVQYILSFELGHLIKRFESYQKKWLNNLIAVFSFMFIFPMIIFVGVGIIMNVGFEDSIGWMVMIMLVYVITGIAMGNSFEKRLDKHSVEKAKKSKLLTISLTAVALAFLNFGFYVMIGGMASDGSAGEIIAFFALLIISGFLPFRLLIMFAPPKNKKNMLIALVVVIYDLAIMYFNSFDNI